MPRPSRESDPSSQTHHKHNHDRHLDLRATLFERLKIGLIISKFREALGAVHHARICITMSSRESIDALQAAAARRAARPAWHSPAPAEAEPSEDADVAEPIATNVPLAVH